MLYIQCTVCAKKLLVRLAVMNVRISAMYHVFYMPAAGGDMIFGLKT
jgi:hypothetical protein